MKKVLRWLKRNPLLAFVGIVINLMVIWLVAVWVDLVQEGKQLDHAPEWGTAFGTTLLAFATFMLALDAFKRPHAERLHEHLKTIKEVIKKWQDEWEDNKVLSPEYNFALNTLNTHIKDAAPLSQKTWNVEQDYLFNDLNVHTNKLYKLWFDYKRQTVEYDSLRRNLLKEIILFLEKESRMQVLSASDPLRQDLLAGSIMLTQSDLFSLVNKKPALRLDTHVSHVEHSIIGNMTIVMVSGVSVIQMFSLSAATTVIDQIHQALPRNEKLTSLMAMAITRYNHVKKLEEELHTLFSKHLVIPLKAVRCDELD